nr:hypothetical protein Iba_chr12aCG11730 [Ipomoea batatas]
MFSLIDFTFNLCYSEQILLTEPPSQIVPDPIGCVNPHHTPANCRGQGSNVTSSLLDPIAGAEEEGAGVFPVLVFITGFPVVLSIGVDQPLIGGHVAIEVEKMELLFS